jgi:hypothetical protein
VVLPQSEAKSLLGTGRVPKIALTGTWDPTQAEISQVEASLNQVAVLSRKGPPYSVIRDPERYFRQYLGLLAGARKLIYVSAYCGFNYEKPPSYWQSKLFEIDDGGTCVWQALYDVSTNKFISLSVNGVA